MASGVLPGGLPDQPGRAAPSRPTTSGPTPRTTYAWTRAPSPHQASSCGSYAGTCRLCAAWIITAPKVRAARIRTAPTTGEGMVAAVLAATGEQLAAGQEGQPEGRHHEEPGQRRELVEVAGDQPDDADADEGGAEGEQEAGEVEATRRVVRREDGGRRPARRRDRRSASAAARPPASRAGRGWPAGSGRRAEVRAQRSCPMVDLWGAARVRRRTHARGGPER